MGGHGVEVADGAGVDESFGGGFEDFKAVEGVEDGGAGDQCAVIFQEHGGAFHGHAVGDGGAVGELLFEGDGVDVAEEDVAFGDGAGVERFPGNREGGGVDGEGVDDGVDVGVFVVEGFVDFDGAGGDFSGFDFAVVDEGELVEGDGFAVDVVAGDEEGVFVEAGGEAAAGGHEEALAVTAADEVGELLTEGFFEGGGGGRGEVGEVGAGFFGEGDLFGGEVAGFSDHAGFNDGFGGELEGFEALEGLLEIFAADGDAVVFEDDAGGAGLEGAGDGFSEGHGAGEFVGGVADAAAAANMGGLREEIGVGNFAADGEGDQRHRMGVDDGAEIGAGFVDGLVERIFGGGFVQALDGAVGLDADDVLAAKGTFVDARGGDPDVAVLIFDGKIPAGGGGHFVGVDAFEGVGEFDAGVDEGAGHVGSSGGIRTEGWENAKLKTQNTKPWLGAWVKEGVKLCLRIIAQVRSYWRMRN